MMVMVKLSPMGWIQEEYKIFGSSNHGCRLRLKLCSAVSEYQIGQPSDGYFNPHHT